MLTKNSENFIKKVFIPFEKKINKGKIINGTVEIMNAHLCFDPTSSKLSYGDLRPFNEVYAQNEEAWYASLDRNIKGHPGIEDNKTWQKCASDDGFINSNYGYLVYAERINGRSQYDYALRSMLDSYKDGNSGRQSVIYYGHPDMHIWWNDNVHAKHDFTCTFETQHFIRDDKLYYIVNQRSADSIFGTTFDFFHHCHVYQNLLRDLQFGLGKKIKVGKIYMNFGSLHVYERHFELVHKIVNAYLNGELK